MSFWNCLYWMGFHPKSSISTHMTDFLHSSYMRLPNLLDIDITGTTKKLDKYYTNTQKSCSGGYFYVIFDELQLYFVSNNVLCPKIQLNHVFLTWPERAHLCRPLFLFHSTTPSHLNIINGRLWQIWHQCLPIPVANCLHPQYKAPTST